MSNQGSSVEIEDVLASIRRLVADDGRGSAARALEPKQVDTAPAPRPAASAKVLRADRLILTPAQRVADQDEPDEPDMQELNGAAADHSGDEPAASDPVLLTEPHRVDTGADAAEDPTDGFDTYEEPLTPLSDAAFEADALDEDAADEAHDDLHEDAALEAVLAEIDDLTAPEIVGYTDDDDGDEDAGDVFDAHDASVEAAHDAEEDDADDEPSATDAILARVVQEELSSALRGDSDAEAPAAPEDAAEPATPFIRSNRPMSLRNEAPERVETAADAPRQGLSLEEKIAELEAMIGGSADLEDWEDEESGQGDNAAFAHRTSSPLEWEDAPAPDAIFQTRRAGALSQIADDLDEDVPGDPPASPLAGLDEQALRELVASVVRSELQGALGERITRNVRKLVRREIQRALMSQHYE